MADTYAKASAGAQPMIHEGMLRSDGKKFAIVASRFNDTIGNKLVDGALDAIHRTGGTIANVEIFRCPGALEIPGLVRRVVDTGRFDAIICIGVVIRGATPHFDLVVNQAVAGIAQIAIESGVAVTCGVLACETIEQAVERAGTKAGNRGADAAMAAIEMADLYASIQADNDSRATKKDTDKEMLGPGVPSGVPSLLVEGRPRSR